MYLTARKIRGQGGGIKKEGVGWGEHRAAEPPMPGPGEQLSCPFSPGVTTAGTFGSPTNPNSWGSSERLLRLISVRMAS